jgi:hypothetical protein
LKCCPHQFVIAAVYSPFGILNFWGEIFFFQSKMFFWGALATFQQNKNAGTIGDELGL